MRRMVLVIGLLVGVGGLIGGGWVAAHAFTSPEQWAAQAAAPSEEPVLAEVRQGDLVDERTIGAMVEPTGSFARTLTGATGAARSIVTASDHGSGDVVTSGEVLVRVNGEPVFALVAPFPFYRDLGVGDSGPDVLALQENLHALGLLTNVDGEFGRGTASALAALYRSVNATAPKRPESNTPLPAEGSDTGEVTATTVESPYFPLSAVITVPALPATLASTPSVGADVGAGVSVSFTATTALLRLTVPTELAGSFVAGADVNCTVSDEPEVGCRVDDVYEESTTSGAAGGEQVVTWADVVPVDNTIGIDRVGSRATIRVLVGRLAEDALLVPSVSVAQHSTESGTVLVQRGDTFESVDVRVLASMNGTTAVVGDLEVGDRLRVDR